MKTTIAVLCLLFSVSINAQRGDRMNQKQKGTPQEMASMQAKKMTLALDLTDSQQKQVEKVLFEAATKRNAFLEERKKSEEVSKEKRFELREKILDEKIKVKRKMKSILNEIQYEKWQKQELRRGKDRKTDVKRRKGK